MNPEKFKTLTEHLIKYNHKLERDVLIKNINPKLCTYCDKSVTNQRITCEAYKLGTADQHFKHKCHACRSFVYDGHHKVNPYTIRPITYNLKASVKEETAPKLSKNGLRMGRPPKVKVEQPKRAVGRPRKKPL